MTLVLFSPLFWVLTSILIIIIFISERNENIAGGIFSIIAYAALFYYIDGAKFVSYLLDWQVWVYYVLLYIVLGILYAYFRSYRMGLDYSRKGYDKHEKFVAAKLKKSVIRWWLTWPISLLNYTFDELIAEALSNFYDRISKLFTNAFALGYNEGTDKNQQ